MDGRFDSIRANCNGQRLVLVCAVFMSGRHPLLACLTCAAALLGMARQGHAQLGYRLSVGSSVGVSDTSGAQTSTGVAPQPDVFAMARASVQLDYPGRLVLDRAAYAFTTTWWIRGQTWSMSHTLDLSSDIHTSATTQVTLDANATLSQLSLADTVAPADLQTLGARPTGIQEFLSLGAREAFAWQLGAMWRLDQMLDGRLYRPIGSNPGLAQNESLTNALGIARLWLRDQAALRTNVGVIESGEAAPAGLQPIPGHQSELAEVLLSWRHDWTTTWTSELAAGALLLHVPGSYTGPTPAGSATLTYRNTGQELELRAARTVSPNVYVGSALERDLVSVRAGLPIGRWQALHLDGMADLEHDSGVGSLGGPTSSANVFFLQAAARYQQPGNMFMYSLQYTFRDQLSSSAAAGTSLFSAFRQQMVMFTVEVHYPAAAPTAPRAP